MLVIKKQLGYQRVYDTKTKQFVTVKYIGKDEDIYGNRVLEDDGKILQADERKNEKLFIVNSFLKQRVIALIEGNKKQDLNHLDINDYLKDPNNHIFFFNLNGEYLVDIQGYDNKNSQFLLETVMSVEFAAMAGANSLTIKRTLMQQTKDGKVDIKTTFYNYPYDKSTESETEIIK